MLKLSGKPFIKFRALEINGKSPVLDELSRWKKSALSEYKKIMKVMRLVATHQRVMSRNHVGKPMGYTDIYYMRAHRGHARVNFFYTENDEIVICTNTYWKTKSSRAEQNRAFRICDGLKDAYTQLTQRRGK